MRTTGIAAMTAIYGTTPGHTCRECNHCTRYTDWGPNAQMNRRYRCIASRGHSRWSPNSPACGKFSPEVKP